MNNEKKTYIDGASSIGLPLKETIYFVKPKNNLFVIDVSYKRSTVKING